MGDGGRFSWFLTRRLVHMYIHGGLFMKRKMGLLLAGVAALGILALGPVTTSASSASAKLNLQNTTLISGGVQLFFVYSCMPNANGSTGGTLSASIDEPGVAFGSNAATLTCDGANHPFDITISGSFTKGFATAQATISNNGGSSMLSIDKQIRLANDPSHCC
jgi:hypothetical protein